MGYIERFNGEVTIRVIFHNAGEYLKFRSYILKTFWVSSDGYPAFEILKENFYDCEDVDRILKKIIYLLQLGFDVSTCDWRMDKKLEELAEEEHPTDDENEPMFDESDWLEARQRIEAYQQAVNEEITKRREFNVLEMLNNVQRDISQHRQGL